jgi:NAD(P)-dependent dehydrogenase (short-subunit alcohol dehydrogenase family)
MKDYTDKVVVITGAGSGMGRAYALEAAARGAKLALNDYDAGALAETVDLLPPGTAVYSEAFDVSERDAVYGFADSVQSELGGADVVINNAGIEGSGQPVWATSDAQLEHIMGINFWGVVHGTRAFLPQVLNGDFGAIVNVSSLFGLIGAPNSADYCAAKFAVRGFTESLSTELLHSSVSVHTVHPGGIATNIARGRDSGEFSAKYLRTRPEEVATLVLDAVGTRQTRIVCGHRAGSTWLGARLLPHWLMSRIIWRDVRPTLSTVNYPASAHAGQPDASSAPAAVR